MNQEQLRSMAAKQDVPMQTIEKDHALTRLLSVAAGFPKIGSLVFKGGTALKKIYYADARFSEDLDFACRDDVSEEFHDFVRDNMAGLDVEFTETAARQRTDKGFKFKAKYARLDGWIDSVRFDVSLRGDILSESPPKPILHPCDDSPPGLSVPTLSLEEIMAEKIRAVMYSRHPRHLYDLYFLHGRGVKLNPEWARLKIKSAYGAEFSMTLFEEHVFEKERLWSRDLPKFVPGDLPPFEAASEKALQVARGMLGS